MIRTSQRGLTLIEIMVALAVVALLIAGAMAGLQPGLQRRRETAAVREMWAASMRARQEAVSRNQTTRLIVEPQVINGVNRTVMRWERPPCGNDWTAVCPSVACQTSTCRAGCTCDEMGTEIVLPPGVDAAQLHGLCFQAGTGRPFYGDSGINCQRPANYLPTLERANITIDKQRRDDGSLLPFRMVFDGITGVPSLIDCAQVGAPPSHCN